MPIKITPIKKKKNQSKGSGGMDIGSPKKTTTKKLGGSMYMKKTTPAVKGYKSGGNTTNKEKSNERFKKAVKKQSKIKGLGGTTTDVNQAKAESMRKKGRRAGPIEKGVLGGILLGVTRGKFGKGAVVTGAKELAKNKRALVTGAKKLAKKVGKTTKDVATSTVKRAKVQPNRGKEYRFVKKEKGKKISGISDKSTRIGTGIRKVSKNVAGGTGLTLVGGNTPKSKKISTPIPKSRPKNLKTSKKLYMKESSGLLKDDNKKTKDSNVEFETKVIKRKK